jgi:TrmH family RNA methyltransferase
MSVKLIQSAQNPYFQDLKKLLSSKGIRKQDRFLVCGEKFIQEILKTSPEFFEAILRTAKHQTDSNMADFDQQIELSNELFKELDIFGTDSPILVCSTPKIVEWKAEKPKGLVLIVGLGEPSNLGAVIRSAVSFGVKKIILLKESASAFHPKAVRASAGNILKVTYEFGPSIQELNLEGILALDMKGESLQNFRWPHDTYLLVGEEGQGIPSNLKFKKIQIPLEKNVESLNAGVAISIAMYSHYLQNLT